MEIRLEQPSDYKTVENLTREAFWNLHVPGCNEHLLVNKLRNDLCFIPELDFVATIGGQVVGNIMYSFATVVDENKNNHKVISFGPLSVLPEFQNQGVGKALIKYSVNVATQMGFGAIIIYGFPAYYHKHGFVSASKFGISRSDGKFAKALMAMELYEGSLKNVSGSFYEPKLFEELSDTEVEAFDKLFTPKQKFRTESQKAFEIMSVSLEEI